MTGEQIVTIVVAILGSGLIQYLIRRHDRLSKIDKIERDGVRLQLLFLMQFRPEEKGKILEVAEYYFHKLKGDWYMTDIFADWLRENDINIPGWFMIRREEKDDSEDKGRD